MKTVNWLTRTRVGVSTLVVPRVSTHLQLICSSDQQMFQQMFTCTHALIVLH